MIKQYFISFIMCLALIPNTLACITEKQKTTTSESKSEIALMNKECYLACMKEKQEITASEPKSEIELLSKECYYDLLKTTGGALVALFTFASLYGYALGQPEDNFKSQLIVKTGLSISAVAGLYASYQAGKLILNSAKLTKTIAATVIG